MTAIARFGDVVWVRFASVPKKLDSACIALCGNFRAAQRHEFGMLRDKSGVIGARKLPKSEWPGDPAELELADEELTKRFCRWCGQFHMWCDCDQVVTEASE